MRNYVCSNCQLRRDAILEVQMRNGRGRGTIDWEWEVEEVGKGVRGRGWRDVR